MVKTLCADQSLSQEPEEGERLVFPFVARMYDASNAALFYAHNGRLDTAQGKLAGGWVLSITKKRLIHIDVAFLSSFPSFAYCMVLFQFP